MSSPTRAPASPTLTVVVLCFGGFTAALSQTMVIPIQPELPGLLATSPGNAGWVVTITLLAGAVAMPVAGRLADLFGKQRVLVVSAGLLVAGSLVCALTASLLPVLVGRGLQGLAMGFIPVGISLMREVTPPEITGTAIAAMSATLGVGGAIGLPLAAWIAQTGDWHVLFWVAAGLAALVLVLSVVVVPHVQDAQPGRFDIAGALGLATGLVLFLVGVSQGNAWGWDDPRTLGTILGGLVLLLAWGVLELRVDDPLVDLRTTAQLPVLMTNVAAVAIGFGMMAQAVVVPQLLQMPEATGYGLGQTILQTGLWMAPGGLMMLLFAPISGRMMARSGARLTLMVGAGVLGAGYLVALFLMNAPWQLLVASCIASAGVGIGYAAMPKLVLDAVPVGEAASAVGVNALMRSVGTSIAAAVMATLLTRRTTEIDGIFVPSRGAFELCFLVGAVAALAGVALAAAIPARRDSTDPVPAPEAVSTS